MKLMTPYEFIMTPCGFYHETDESMWILYKNLCGFVTEIQDFHTHKAEIVVNFDTSPLG